MSRIESSLGNGLVVGKWLIWAYSLDLCDAHRMGRPLILPYNDNNKTISTSLRWEGIEPALSDENVEIHHKCAVGRIDRKFSMVGLIDR